MKYLYKLLIALWVLIPVFISAEENRGEAETTIVVTADRSEKPLKDTITRTEVIRREEITNRGARNLSEILETRPGIEVRPGIRGQEIRMLGLDPQYVLILVDGQRVTGRIDGSIDLTRFKAEEIERIEIIKGPSSALYGSDALGGVVNIITRKPSAPYFAEGEFQYGSGRKLHFGSGNETHVSATTGLSKERYSTIWTAGWHRSDGYDLTPRSERRKDAERIVSRVPGVTEEDLPGIEDRTGAAFEDLNVSNRTTFDITDNWDILGRVNYRFLDQNKTDLNPPRTVLERSNETHDIIASAQTNYRFSDIASLHVAGSYSRFFDRLELDQRDSDELDRRENQDDRVQEANIQFQYNAGRHILTAGIDGLWEEYISPRISNGGYGYRQRVAGYIQDEYRPFDEYLFFVPGVRYEHDSQFGSQTTPRLAMRYDPSKNWRFRAGAGRGYRAPSFKDLYFAFQNPGVGYQVTGNENLKPEKSVGYNASVEYEPVSWMYFNLEGYYNSVTNLIELRRQPDANNNLTTFRPVNVNRARTAGSEFSVTFLFWQDFQFMLGYNYNYTEDLSQNIPLEGRALHRGFYSVSYSPPLGFGFTVRGNVNSKQSYYYEKESVITLQPDLRVEIDPLVINRAILQNRQYGILDTDPNAPHFATYEANPSHILNVRIHYRTENLEFFAGADNVLDHYNLQFDPVRPRFYYAGIRTFFEAPAPEKLPSEIQDNPASDNGSSIQLEP